MEITRTRAESRRGPAEWFTGEVWLDEIAAPSPPSRMTAYNVHFTPGARTAWHRHPFGQVIHVTEGVGARPAKGRSSRDHPAGRHGAFRAR
jgi:quercetin dioxygenase-like cupin family protein